MTRPLLILGISGATWDVLDPLIHAGRLPTLQKLRDEGCSGALESIRADGDEHYRPQVAWASVATGCMPARHGITRFFHDGEDLRVPALWHIWAAAGGTVGIYGWPGTWPPPALRGFVIPSHLARDERTWPPELAPVKALDRLQQTAEREPDGANHIRTGSLVLNVLLRHHVGPRRVARLAALAAKMAPVGTEYRRLLRRAAKLELNAAVVSDLRRRFKPDLLSFHTFLPDFAMHRFWRYWQPELFNGTPSLGERELSEAIPHAHEHVDRVLGDLLASSSAGTIVAVVSEHGMAPEPRAAEVGDRYWSLRARHLLDVVGLGRAAEPCPVARWVAYRPLAGGGAALEEVATRLRGIRIAATARPLLQVIQHREEVIVKLDLDDRLDAELGGLHLMWTGYACHSRTSRGRSAHVAPAMHARDGVLIVSGKGIRREHHVNGARVVDVLPTLLAASGNEVPPGLDGDVLEVFE